jgi:hypothetical protein
LMSVPQPPLYVQIPSVPCFVINTHYVPRSSNECHSSFYHLSCNYHTINVSPFPPSVLSRKLPFLCYHVLSSFHRMPLFVYRPSLAFFSFPSITIQS